MTAADVHALLAAASSTTDRDLRAVYLARARVAVEEMREEVRRIDLLVGAMELELARSSPVQTTLAIGGTHGAA